MSGTAPVFAAIYKCPTCGEEFATEAAVREFFASTPDPVFKVGDIVTLPGQYAWNDGDDHWVVGGNGRRLVDVQAPRLQFYYVVTSVDSGNRQQSAYNLHRPICSIRTRGVFNGHERGACGWNSIEGHIPMTLAENPPAQVVEESKAFIGETYFNLI